MIISQINLVANVKDWMINYRDICIFFQYTNKRRRKDGLLRNSRTTNFLVKEIKQTSKKTLTLNDMLHVSNINANLILVAILRKVEIKLSFEYYKIVMTKNNVFIGKGH